MLLNRIICPSSYLLLTLGLSPALWVPFEQVVWARENAAALSAPSVHHLWSNARRLPATLTAWKEVDLVYERIFPYDRVRQPHPPAGCVVLPAISTRNDMLRCQERIDLLRPARWVSNQLHQQNRQGYLLLSMPEMGIIDVHVQLVAIRSSAFNPAIVAMKSASSRPVIGLFIRHTTNVKQYTFKDTITGKLEKIKATPNHPFYVVNRQRYISVSHLSPHDQLVNVLGHPVTLVCPPGKSSHCGQPYHPGKVITVYNLEVYGQHRYFVGEPGILVHNVYKCKHCKKEFQYLTHFEQHAAIHPGYKPFECELCNRRFRYYSKGLQKHLRNFHHRGKKYECTLCKKNFFSNESLQKHLKGQTHRYLQEQNIRLSAHNTPDALNAPADASSVAPDASEETEQEMEPFDPMISQIKGLPRIPPLVQSMGDNYLSALLRKIVDNL